MKANNKYSVTEVKSIAQFVHARQTWKTSRELEFFDRCLISL